MNEKEILILTGAGFGQDMGLPLENEIIKIGSEACKVLKPELIEKLTEEWKLIDSVHSFENYSFEQLLTKIMLEEQSIIRPYEERLKIFYHRWPVKVKRKVACSTRLLDNSGDQTLYQQGGTDHEQSIHDILGVVETLSEISF